MLARRILAVCALALAAYFAATAGSESYRWIIACLQIAVAAILWRRPRSTTQLISG